MKPIFHQYRDFGDMLHSHLSNVLGSPEKPPAKPMTLGELKSDVDKRVAKYDQDRPKEASREALKTPEFMDKEEVNRMVECQKLVMRQYLNPSYLIYLEATNKIGVADPAFELVMQYPHDFYYKKEGDAMTIMKRVPHSKQDEIPNNFSIYIEGGTGKNFITKVNGVDTDIRGWTDWEYYEKKINELNQRFIAEANFAAKHPGTPYTEPGGVDIRAYESYVLKLPHRLQKCMELRNTAGVLNTDETEVNNGLKERLKDHPKSNKDIDEAGMRAQIYVSTTKDNPGVFEVNQTATGNFASIYGLSDEGFVMESKMIEIFNKETQTKENVERWVKKNDYEQAMKDRYYKAKPEAPGAPKGVPPAPSPTPPAPGKPPSAPPPSPPSPPEEEEDE